MSTWCRVCFEHDCGIDHRDNRVVRKLVRSPKPKPRPRKDKGKKEPRKAPSAVQLKLF